MFQQITNDGERITSPMPADDSLVEVKMKDGSIIKAWYFCDIQDRGDWDFIEAKGAHDPDGGPSIASDVVAWRPAALA